MSVYSTRGIKYSNVNDKKSKILHPGEEMTQIIWITKTFSFHVKAKKKKKHKKAQEQIN